MAPVTASLFLLWTTLRPQFVPDEVKPINDPVAQSENSSKTENGEVTRLDPAIGAKEDPTETSVGSDSITSSVLSNRKQDFGSASPFRAEGPELKGSNWSNRPSPDDFAIGLWKVKPDTLATCPFFLSKMACSSVRYPRALQQRSPNAMILQ